MDIDLVFKEIAHINGVTPDQMKCKGRRSEIIKAKRMFCGYIRKNSRLTFQTIGEYISSDHSTAVYHCKIHNQLNEINLKGKRFDEDYANQYEIIERLLSQYNLSRSVIAKYLWVLDFSNGEVYRYNIDDRNWNPETHLCQEFLRSKGHNIIKCSWMVGTEDKFKINPNKL
tara:strand:- start:602 stop:1114 length:513 start_codon:yes stop_codon:yes gene_type:complete